MSGILDEFSPGSELDIRAGGDDLYGFAHKYVLEVRAIYDALNELARRIGGKADGALAERLDDFERALGELEKAHEELKARVDEAHPEEKEEESE